MVFGRPAFGLCVVCLCVLQNEIKCGQVASVTPENPHCTRRYDEFKAVCSWRQCLLPLQTLPMDGGPIVAAWRNASMADSSTLIVNSWLFLVFVVVRCWQVG